MVVSRLILWICVPGLITALSACSTYRDPKDGTVPAVSPPGKPAVVAPVTRPPLRPAEPATSAAWRPLLAKAEQASARGDYEQALALLERAQRIDPDSAEVYLCMARTHRARGDGAQARATAERGLLYCATSQQCEALRVYVR